MDNLKELFRQMGEDLQNEGKQLDTITEINIRVASYDPLGYQVIVKMRDAGMAWAGAVDPNPEKATIEALGIAMRGESARKELSEFVFHQTRERAGEFADKMIRENPGQILMTKTEFEPYKGWVVVLIPEEGVNLDHLRPLVEVRQAVEVVRGPVSPPPRSTQSSTPPPPSSPAPKTKGVGSTIPVGERVGMTKYILEAEYKGIFGKGPDRNIKKADLALLLEAHQASSSAGSPPDQDEDEDDDERESLL